MLLIGKLQMWKVLKSLFFISLGVIAGYEICIFLWGISPESIVLRGVRRGVGVLGGILGLMVMKRGWVLKNLFFILCGGIALGFFLAIRIGWVESNLLSVVILFVSLGMLVGALGYWVFTWSMPEPPIPRCDW